MEQNPENYDFDLKDANVKIMIIYIYIYIFQEVFTAQSYSQHTSMQVRVLSSIPLYTETNITKYLVKLFP